MSDLIRLPDGYTPDACPWYKPERGISTRAIVSCMDCAKELSSSGGILDVRCPDCFRRRVLTLEAENRWFRDAINVRDAEDERTINAYRSALAEKTSAEKNAEHTQQHIQFGWVLQRINDPSEFWRREGAHYGTGTTIYHATIFDSQEVARRAPADTYGWRARFVHRTETITALMVP